MDIAENGAGRSCGPVRRFQRVRWPYLGKTLDTVEVILHASSWA